MNIQKISNIKIAAGITTKKMNRETQASQWFSFPVYAGKRVNIKMDSVGYNMKLYDSSGKVIALSLNTTTKSNPKSIYFNSNRSDTCYLNIYGDYKQEDEKPDFTINLWYESYGKENYESNLSRGLEWIRSMNHITDYPVKISFDQHYSHDYSGEVTGKLDMMQLEELVGELEFFHIPEIIFRTNQDGQGNYILEGNINGIDIPQSCVVVYADVTDRPYIQAITNVKPDGSFFIKKSFMTKTNPVIYLYREAYDYREEEYHVPSGNDSKYICQTGLEPAGAAVAAHYKIDLGVTTDHRYSITDTYLYSDGSFNGRLGGKGLKSACLVETKTGKVITSNERTKTGLIRSYCIENKDEKELSDHPEQSWIYDNALAVIAYCASGIESDRKRAEELLEGLEKLQINPGELNFFYHVNSGLLQSSYILRSGAQAWVGYSILVYIETTGDRKFLPFAENIASLLISRQDAESGSVKGGPDVTWFSTEHNIDVYYFLRDLAGLTGNIAYGEAAQRIKFSLMTAHLNQETNTLNQGIEDPALALDCATWGGTFFNSIGETEMADHSYRYAMKYQVTDTMPLSLDRLTWNSLYTTDEELTGFCTYLPGNGSYMDAPKAIWSEGTMGAVSLGLRRGKDTDIYLRSMCKMQDADFRGGLVYMNRSYTEDPYRFQVWPSVAGTAWLYFTMAAPELLWGADNFVTGSIKLESDGYKVHIIPFLNSIKDTSGGEIRYSEDGKNWGKWELAVEKEISPEMLKKPLFYQFKLENEISSIYTSDHLNL